MKPFERPPFRTVPQSPRVPHDFFASPLQRVPVSLAGRTLELAYRVVDHRSRALGAERKSQVGGSTEAEPLLLVHGLMTTSYSWRYVMAPLAELGFRVYAFDLPGAGDSDVPRGACTAELLAASIGAFQDALGIAGGKVIGNSMGGYLAMRLALDAPDRFDRLVNVHSPGVPLRRLWALRAALRLAPVRRALSAVVARDPERWVYRNVHYYDETLKSREETRTYAAPLRSAEGRRAFISWMGDALDPALMRDFVATLAARRDRGEPFPVPLMLLYADEDPMVPPSVGRELARLLPDAEQVWLTKSSHFAHVDTPDLFVDAVRPFLS